MRKMHKGEESGARRKPFSIQRLERDRQKMNKTDIYQNAGRKSQKKRRLKESEDRLREQSA